VIVADVTVDRNGQVTRTKIVRSPGIARLNNTVLASLKTASPLPAPPSGLVKTGAMTYSETWLFTNDSRWRLRTLTMPQE
jgi:protein TonB